MQKIQILLVEDDAWLRRVLRTNLGAMGYRVTSVGDLARLKVALGAGPFQLAIVAFSFPRRPDAGAEPLGFEAQRLLRRRGIPILGISPEGQRPAHPEHGLFGDEFLCVAGLNFVGNFRDTVRRMLEEVGGGA